ncbi:putative inorganic phosphate cotransporter isoform X1 [Drosophila persimilis]|uniref:putative inorganic phosphate cotransporter isoform X1 n=2 Tax=Drosophila persimilis TaxID=7234 RepID=UPI000F089845|nr:putative inorganic phosphate cotransporter isoform X1 [Drosophila persimilis]
MNTKAHPLGIRHVQTVLLFLNLTVNYIVRLSVGVRVVAMTDKATNNETFPQFDWTEAEKSYIFSSFNWGYLLMQIPGCFLVRCLGAKLPMIVATFFVALFSLCTPIGIQMGDWKGFCAIRLGQGLCQGLMLPCIHEHLAKWSPPEELKQLGVIAYSGTYCGTILALLGSGYIADSSIGWPGISYVSAAACLSWCLLWFFWGENEPGSSYWIGSDERNYIESCLKSGTACPRELIPIPWLAILGSVPFRALVVVHCAQRWADSTMEVQIPSYLDGILQVKITRNGLISSLPYMVKWIMSHVYILIAHVAIMRHLIDQTPLQKWIVTISTWGPALLYIAIGFLDRANAGLVVVLMTIKEGFSAGSSIGGTMNTIALAPNHSAVLLGIMSVLSEVFTPLTPLVTGVIVTDPTNRSQWQIIFCLIALVFFLSNWVYIIWGSSELQPWDAGDFLHVCTAECSARGDHHDSPDLSIRGKIMLRDLARRVTEGLDKMNPDQADPQKNSRPKLKTEEMNDDN